ncbi:SYNERG-CTERM sorting domain-containing protein, partial [Synergistaceae bacterium OttesenSCG-928-D05]|nr:SYNERG-CTERM sorting domain-containing protein [Synergistaceae bacterium OttesenSCG-928-D05]
QNGVAIRAFSPFLPTSAQRDPESQTVILWGSAHGDGNGGGCSGIGSGAAALLALAGLPLLLRRKR